MARTQTMVQLTQHLIAKLDEEAAERGTSRSAVIREAIESHIAAREHGAIGEAIAEGYRRIPPGTPDEWGDPELMADIATREGLQRLDLEEREGGRPVVARGDVWWCEHPEAGRRPFLIITRDAAVPVLNQGAGSGLQTSSASPRSGPSACTRCAGR